MTYISPRKIEFNVVRPLSGVESNVAGERVQLTVERGGTKSKPLATVLDTYVMLVLGDSVLASVGLQEGEKIHSLVEAGLQAQPGNRKVYKRVLAHTGARIGMTPLETPGLAPVDSQVPTPFPTIGEQVQNYASAPDGALADIDLIVTDGCANDISFFSFLDPQKSEAEVMQMTNEACYGEALLLAKKIGTTFPNAKVVFAGYYPIIGPGTAHKDVINLMLALNNVWYAIPVEVVKNLTPEKKEQLVKNSLAFTSSANGSLQNVTNAMNAGSSGTRFRFADPKFSPANAAFTGASTWIFGIKALSGGILVPEDHPNVAAARKSACQSVGSPRTDVEFCKRASAGHPNALGAKAYAGAILSALQ